MSSFLSLAEEQEISDIKVGDITRRADVNRNTFYLHYRDKNDLVTQTLDTLFDALTAESRAFADEHRSFSPNEVPASTIALFQELSSHPTLYRRLLGEAGSTAFADWLRAFHEANFLRLWHDLNMPAAGGSPPAEMRARFAATAMEGAIGWWLSSGGGIAPEQAAGWAWELLSPLWFAATGLERAAT